MQRFNHLLEQAVARGASDVHMMAERDAALRIHGQLALQEDERWSSTQLEQLFQQLIRQEQQQEWQVQRTLDLGYSLPAGPRFRLNLYQAQGRLALVARYLDNRFKSFEALHLPAQIRQFADLSSGLVLVTGATGSGKSTTLAAIINEINHTHAHHILTVEDPVEFVHLPVKSLISHREVHVDVSDFAAAVKAALREDPDVILVGEMRDAETLRAALTAAETGHLVFSTLHTADAPGAVERFIGGFPADEQDSVRHRLGLALKGVVAQRLMPGADGGNRVPINEILVVNAAVANLIATARTKQIYSAIEGGAELGMQTFDQSLASQVRAGRIALTDARLACRDPQGFDRLAAHAAAASSPARPRREFV